MRFDSFWIGVLIGLTILWYTDALPTSFSQYGYKHGFLTSITTGTRLHHSTLGIIGFFIASLMKRFELPCSRIVLGISMLFLISQLPEIFKHGTLFWND
jgi:hypothetical protein